MVVGCQPYAPTAFTPQEILLVLISVRGRVGPIAIVQSEGFYVNEKYNDTIWNLFLTTMFIALVLLHSHSHPFQPSKNQADWLAIFRTV